MDKGFKLLVIALIISISIVLALLIIPSFLTKENYLIDYIPSRVLYDYVVEGYNVTYIVTNLSSGVRITEPMPMLHLPSIALDHTETYAVGVIDIY